MHCASGSEFETHAIPHNSPFNYGKAVGLLHNAAGGFTATNSSRLMDPDALIWAPLRRVEEHFAAHTAALEFLRNFAGQLTQEIATLDAEGLRKMFIHGDLTGGNGNQDSNGNYTLFDFDCCGFGWQAYDLAVFLWSLMHNNRVHLWSEFLEGYRSEAPLDQNDENSIGLFVAARSYWIMGYSMARVPVLGSHSYRESLFMRDVEFIKKIPKMLPKRISHPLAKLTQGFDLPDV